MGWGTTALPVWSVGVSYGVDKGDEGCAGVSEVGVGGGVDQDILLSDDSTEK